MFLFCNGIVTRRLITLRAACCSTMETKDTRLNAALETTKQLLVRAEQREERIVQIYDQVGVLEDALRNC